MNTSCAMPDKKKSILTSNTGQTDVSDPTKQSRKVAKKLSCVLSDAFVLYMKTHNATPRLYYVVMPY